MTLRRVISGFSWDLATDYRSKSRQLRSHIRRIKMQSSLLFLIRLPLSSDTEISYSKVEPELSEEAIGGVAIEVLTDCEADPLPRGNVDFKQDCLPPL